ncbi:hypothetical protein OAO01_01555 [Oligoflexia bacterium]|nr:hypothetical protein [Oligoflexia bacterium]
MNAPNTATKSAAFMLTLAACTTQVPPSVADMERPPKTSSVEEVIRDRLLPEVQRRGGEHWYAVPALQENAGFILRAQTRPGSEASATAEEEILDITVVDYSQRSSGQGSVWSLQFDTDGALLGASTWQRGRLPDGNPTVFHPESGESFGYDMARGLGSIEAYGDGSAAVLPVTEDQRTTLTPVMNKLQALIAEKT